MISNFLASNDIKVFGRTYLFAMLLLIGLTLFLHPRCFCLALFLLTHVNNSVNMAEQLRCNEIHSKNIENMLSKFYICMYSIVHDVIKYTQNINLFIVFNGRRITNYVMCVSGCFVDVKAEGASLSTPSFINFLPFYKLNEEKGR